MAPPADMDYDRRTRNGRCRSGMHFSFSSHLKLAERWKAHWPFLVALVPVTLASFCQDRAPLLFLIYPTVALILFRMGLGWASISTLFVTAVGSWFTLRGMGPFWSLGSLSPVGPTMLLQLYIASGMFLVFAAASVLDTLRSTEKRLRETVSLHKLITENLRDAIILADFNGNRSYVSDSAATWGGWSRGELMGMLSLDLVHPEDRGRAEAIIRSLRLGSDGGLLECRAKKSNGEYTWVEANLRPVRDPVTGVPLGVLNMVRDISKRKKAELELKKANTALQALAVTDEMTHLANRRRFDQALSDEWRRGLRERSPLSLLLLDADWFKSYNDTYGHPRGDSCLKQIAEATLEVVTRPGDLVARIGGEEFAVILPNTPAEGALEVANQYLRGGVSTEAGPQYQSAWHRHHIDRLCHPDSGSRNARNLPYAARRQGSLRSQKRGTQPGLLCGPCVAHRGNTSSKLTSANKQKREPKLPFL